MADEKDKAIEKSSKENEALLKLKRTQVEVSINSRRTLLDYSKGELERIEKISTVGMAEKDLKALEGIKATYRKNIENYSKQMIEGWLVPLKFKEAEIVKSGIFEAIKLTGEYGFDEDVRLRAMVRAERAWTIFFALRKKEDINQRYYAVPEDAGKEPESTISELYDIYSVNFVLTEEERKNF